jgi:hypothetical protein
MKSNVIIGFYLLLFVSRSMSGEFDDKQRLAVVNYGENYLYTVYINKEPVDYGHNPSSLEWTGYPIVAGTNDVTFIANPLKENSGPVNCVITIGNVQNQVVERVEGLLKGKEMKKSFAFKFDNVMQQKMPYERIIATKLGVTNELKQLVLRFSKDFANRKFDTLTQLTGMDTKTLTIGYPAWFSDSKVHVTATCVEKSDDLVVLVGERLAVVGPTSGFLQRNVNGGLFSVHNSKLGAIISKDSFVFCRRNNRWCVLLSDSNFVQLKE